MNRMSGEKVNKWPTIRFAKTASILEVSTKRSRLTCVIAKGSVSVRDLAIYRRALPNASNR
jgi:hypothetical protein